MTFFSIAESGFKGFLVKVKKEGPRKIRNPSIQYKKRLCH